MQNLMKLVRVCFGLFFLVNELVADGVVSFNVNWEVHEVGENVGQSCPNNRTRCSERQTCCVTKHDSYHCCRYANAVCCPDKFHCCPHGSTCDTEHKRCRRRNEDKVINFETTKEPMEWPLLKSDNEIKLKDEIMCPNNKTKCKDTKTCCVTKYNNYYCCPHKNAVCCSDKYQCCPSGTTCDLANKKCVESSFDSNSEKPLDLVPPKRLYFHTLISATKLEKKCQNNKYSCPGHKPCCVMDGGKFGCCQYEKGVCCPDMKTCCNHGTTCDVKNGKCFSDSINLVPIN